MHWLPGRAYRVCILSLPAIKFCVLYLLSSYWYFPYLLLSVFMVIFRLLLLVGEIRYNLFRLFFRLINLVFFSFDDVYSYVLLSFCDKSHFSLFSKLSTFKCEYMCECKSVYICVRLYMSVYLTLRSCFLGTL